MMKERSMFLNLRIHQGTISFRGIINMSLLRCLKYFTNMLQKKFCISFIKSDHGKKFENVEFNIV
ncbi:hypothetical protein CR513_54823, partial [Mucuna pruriens]